jgi:pimeloyl-ACP methyl ester carboxylesterase
MSAIETTTVEAEGGARLAVDVNGKGPDLLLVTGLGGTSAFWEPVVAPLSERFRVIRLDQRGVARSTRGTVPKVDIDVLARDCHAVLKHVGAARALFVGHSTGGVILQTMAIQNEAPIRGLILSGTWLKPNRYMTELFNSRKAVLRELPRAYAAQLAFSAYPPEWLNTNWARLDAAVAGALTDPAAREAMLERIDAIIAYDHSADVHRITAPQLILGAEDDLIVPAFLQRELMQALPQAQSHFFASGGHFFPITQTDGFLAQVRGFADRHARA